MFIHLFYVLAEQIFKYIFYDSKQIDECIQIDGGGIPLKNILWHLS